MGIHYTEITTELANKALLDEILKRTDEQRKELWEAIPDDLYICTKKVKKFIPPNAAMAIHHTVNRMPKRWKNMQKVTVKYEIDNELLQGFLACLPQESVPKVKANLLQLVAVRK